MLIELLQQDGLNPKRKGPGEHSSPCPVCGGNDRFIVKTTGKGHYWCRQCGIKGDAIEYLKKFRGMSFREAAAYTGKDIRPLPGKRNSHGAPPAKPAPSMVTIAPPPKQWTANAESLTREANKALLADPVKLDWLLNQRGITRQTAERFRLGWIYRNIYASRTAWGLPEEMADSGKAKKLLIPSGLLIPGPDRLRIRRSEPGDYGKYFVLPGSGNAPLIINGHLTTDRAAALIVESELDAILLCQELRNKFVIVATGSTSNGPSEKMIEDLQRRPFVLVSLDSDEAGGKASWSRWLNVLRNACRTPVPGSWGKDHTEAHIAGHDLNLWLSTAYEIVMEMNMETNNNG